MNRRSDEGRTFVYKRQVASCKLPEYSSLTQVLLPKEAMAPIPPPAESRVSVVRSTGRVDTCRDVTRIILTSISLVSQSSCDLFDYAFDRQPKKNGVIAPHLPVQQIADCRLRIFCVLEGARPPHFFNDCRSMFHAYSFSNGLADIFRSLSMLSRRPWFGS